MGALSKKLISECTLGMESCDHIRSRPRSNTDAPVSASPALKSCSKDMKSVPNDCMVPKTTNCIKNETTHTTQAHPASTSCLQNCLAAVSIICASHCFRAVRKRKPLDNGGNEIRKFCQPIVLISSTILLQAFSTI